VAQAWAKFDLPKLGSIIYVQSKNEEMGKEWPLSQAHETTFFVHYIFLSFPLFTLLLFVLVHFYLGQRDSTKKEKGGPCNLLFLQFLGRLNGPSFTWATWATWAEPNLKGSLWTISIEMNKLESMKKEADLAKKFGVLPKPLQIGVSSKSVNFHPASEMIVKNYALFGSQILEKLEVINRSLENINENFSTFNKNQINISNNIYRWLNSAAKVLDKILDQTTKAETKEITLKAPGTQPKKSAASNSILEALGFSGYSIKQLQSATGPYYSVVDDKNNRIAFTNDKALQSAEEALMSAVEFAKELKWKEKRR